jgi:hypothetical protein
VTVKDLIKILENLDKNLNIYLFQTDNNIISLEEEMIDTTLSDRVDINIPDTE